MSEWISVDERMPEVNGGIRSDSVLVRRDCGEGSAPSMVVTFLWGIDYVKEGRMWHEQEECGYRVTHWMPLPGPPSK